MYKVGQPIDVTYQPEKAASGETVTMEIYDETGSKDVVDFPDITMTEIGTTGRYVGTFTPDANGTWTVMIHYSTDKGNVVKTYRVGTYDLDSIGSAVEVFTDGVPFVT